jgi:hypothetical protein
MGAEEGEGRVVPSPARPSAPRPAATGLPFACAPRPGRAGFSECGMAGAAGAGWDAPGRCGEGAVKGAVGAEDSAEVAAGRPIVLRGSSWREGNMKPTGCEDGWPPPLKGDESAGRIPKSLFGAGDGRPALLERGVAYIAI